MGVQTCGCVDADGCKQKRKKKKNTFWGVSSVRMGMRACGRADGRAEADNCKEKKKEKKEKKKEKLTGLGVWTCYGWACVCLRADIDGCKQINEKRGKKKEMEWTYHRWWA